MNSPINNYRKRRILKALQKVVKLQYNSVGQLIKEDKIEQQIDFSGYSKELYFVQISSQGHNKTFKVVKD